MRRVVIELRLPVSLGREAIQERARSLAAVGFDWDASRPHVARPGGRDEITPDNPTDRIIRLYGQVEPDRQEELETEPDVVAVVEDASPTKST